MADYKIETLTEMFARHADEADEDQKLRLIKFKTDHPDKIIPNDLSENFNVARALSVMAKEIQELKDIFNGDLRDEDPFP